jgi:cytidylate kinase
MIITIDGPAGSGKSTAARELARALGIAHLDTGATYRAVTLLALRRGIDLADESALAELARGMDIRMVGAGERVGVLLDGLDVTDEIRTEAVSANSRHAAASPAVREVLVGLQRRLGRQLGSFVTEGRDQGSVVFPEADVKFYLDARPGERARRRCEELRSHGQQADPDAVLAAIEDRDRRDRGRPVGPLRVPDGATVIDTSDMDIAQVTERMLQHVRARR